MAKLITLDKDYSIKLKNQAEEFLGVNYIYVPIYNTNVTFKRGQYVYKDELLYDTYYSPISGNIVGVELCKIGSNKSIPALKIENDFLEKYKTRTSIRRKINNLSYDDILKSVCSCELKAKLSDPNIETIIVSGIDDEPYIANEIFTGKSNTKELLEMLDSLSNAFKVEKAVLVFKNVDGENIEAFTNYLGTYKNIEMKLVDDLYLLGKEEYLIHYLQINAKYLFLRLSEVYALYTMIKKKKTTWEKYITITGDYIKTPRVFKVKLGTRVRDILSTYYMDLDLDKCEIFVNGMMSGHSIDCSDLIVDDYFLGLVIMKKGKSKSYNCINCGKCKSICPIGSDPKSTIHGKKVKCIHCGLCTYICPSYIHLKKYLDGDKNV